MEQLATFDKSKAQQRELVGRCRFTPGLCCRPHACFQLLKLKHDKVLSNFAFNCNLRHYKLESEESQEESEEESG